MKSMTPTNIPQMELHMRPPVAHHTARGTHGTPEAYGQAALRLWCVRHAGGSGRYVSAQALTEGLVRDARVAGDGRPGAHSLGSRRQLCVWIRRRRGTGFVAASFLVSLDSKFEFVMGGRSG